MREIKFRAWDKREKRMWWNVQEAYDTLKHHCCENLEDCKLQDKIDFYPSSFGYALDDKDLIFMQFTGLYDKSRKEIYEGDEIKCEDLYCEVKWSEFESGWEFNSDGKSILIRPDYTKEHWEVIGNIYENAE